jgi:hypothetical protein
MIQLPQRLVECGDARTALCVLCNGFVACKELLVHAEAVHRDDLPPTYAHLLGHREHMTTVLEAHYGEPVRLDVVVAQQEANSYSRLIRLTLPSCDRVVEVGVARTNLDLVPAAVRDEILSRKAPLGDILIRHGVLRRVEPKWFLRFAPASLIHAFFDPQHTSGSAGGNGPNTEEKRQRAVTYGRIGIINCAGEPAIEVLEVMPSDA